MEESHVKLTADNGVQMGLRERLISLLEWKKRNKEDTEAYEKERKSVMLSVENYMLTNGHDSVKFEYKQEATGKDGFKRYVDKGIRIITVTRRKIEFFPNVLEEKLGKELCKKFIKRTYTINDWDGMVAMLKEKGIKPGEFIKFIDVDKQVETDKLEQLEAIGEIKRSELNGAYSVKEVSSYLKMDEYTVKDK